ncbi:MAG: DUF2125 domain-containing protein [Rhodospirillales bacterium]|nr:DUF2125 domain-containing protein [Rhodospirillales bacterium]
MRRPRTKGIQNAFKRHPVYDYRPPVYFAALKWGGIAIAALTLMVALYVGYWYFAAGQLRDGVLAWIDERRGEGLAITYAQLDIGGFPGWLKLRLDGPNISSPDAQPPWGWEGATLEAEMRPWNPNRVTVRAAGDHAVLFGTGVDLVALAGRAERADGEFAFKGGALSAMIVDLAGVDLGVAGGKTAWKLDRGRLELVIAPETDEEGPQNVALDARLQLGGFRVPEALNLPLGPEIERLELNASLTGDISDGPLVPALGAWRDQGGIIEVRRLSGLYGPLTMNADGTLALDAALQPIGAFTARIGGFFETVDVLRERGIVRARDAVTAKMVLGVLARRSSDGRGGLTVPLTIQDRQFFAGPVPLMEIPEVTWPGGKLAP